jgi:hypothetical protein
VTPAVGPTRTLHGLSDCDRRGNVLGMLRGAPTRPQRQEAPPACRSAGGVSDRGSRMNVKAPPLSRSVVTPRTDSILSDVLRGVGFPRNPPGTRRFSPRRAGDPARRPLSRWRALPTRPRRPVRADGLAAAELPAVDFADAYEVVVPPGVTARPLAEAVFTEPPRWVDALLAIRHAIVAPLGLVATPGRALPRRRPGQRNRRSPRHLPAPRRGAWRGRARARRSPPRLPNLGPRPGRRRRPARRRYHARPGPRRARRLLRPFCGVSGPLGFP